MASSKSNGVSGSSTLTIPLQINGQDVSTESTLDVLDPATGKLLWHAAAASVKDANAAVEAAQAAFPAWSRTKYAVRRDIFLRAADIMARRAEELSRYMMEETGAVEAFASFNLNTGVEMLKDVAGRIVTISGSVPVCGADGTSAMLLKEPYGVVLSIAPWNSPYILGTRAAAYALATGNTCVLKGPELSPRCYWAIGSVFAEAGLPAGCLNTIVHQTQDAPAITTALIEHPAVKKINYTGSTAVGAIIAAAAGKNLKPVLMELGGKASAIVLKDANLEKAALGCTLGAFLHSGQVCMSTERILVHSSILDSFKTALGKAISNVHPTSGPAPILIASAGVSKNKSLVSQALSSGAKLVHGDHPDSTSETSKHRMRPIVIEGVTKDHDIFQQESFGPTVSLYPFETEEEALELANDTDYGLAAAVFTEDLGSGLRVAKGIESGAIHINHMSIHDEPNIPHGGVKKSGFGRFNASAGLEEFLKMKTITWQDS